jgi:hypothetical protein
LDGAFGGRHDQNGCRLAGIARRHHLAFVCGIGRQVVSGDGSPPTGPCAMLGDGKRSERQGDATWIVLRLLDFLPFYRCSYVIRWKSAAIGTPSPSPVPAPLAQPTAFCKGRGRLDSSRRFGPSSRYTGGDKYQTHPLVHRRPRFSKSVPPALRNARRSGPAPMRGRS